MVEYSNTLKPKTNKYKQVSTLNLTNNRNRRKIEKETESLYRASKYWEIKSSAKRSNGKYSNTTKNQQIFINL